MISRGNPTPLDFGGKTGKETAQGFVRIGMGGMDAVLKKFYEIADSVSYEDKALAVRRASRPILDGYKEKAKAVEATGNLARSTKTLMRKYRSGEIAVAVTGPEQTGNAGANNKRASGNHAFLVEFGSKPRRPGSQNRRTYVNVHQMINGKMSRHSSTNDEAFGRMGAGYYFLMGSINEPTRQARMGRGYPHDFMRLSGDSEMRPMTLHPGETYGAMPGRHLMQKTIQQKGGQVRAILESELTQLINKASR